MFGGDAWRFLFRSKVGLDVAAANLGIAIRRNRADLSDLLV
jgi:hypothetical protein